MLYKLIVILVDQSLRGTKSLQLNRDQHCKCHIRLNIPFIDNCIAMFSPDP